MLTESSQALTVWQGKARIRNYSKACARAPLVNAVFYHSIKTLGRNSMGKEDKWKRNERVQVALRMLRFGGVVVLDVEILGVVVMEKESTEVSGLRTKIIPEPRVERGQCLGDP